MVALTWAPLTALISAFFYTFLAMVALTGATLTYLVAV
jgi:hypothetical protein